VKYRCDYCGKKYKKEALEELITKELVCKKCISEILPRLNHPNDPEPFP